MGRTLILNGSDWRLKGYLGEDWLWRNAHAASTADASGWLQATVPGSVQNDLLRAGLIPDPYYELNSLLVEWVPARTWLYVKDFIVPAAWQGCRVAVVFKGVDYSARFFLNGDLLGSHEGVFSPAVFDISSRARYGNENRLAVILDPAPVEQPQVGYTSRVRTRKSRMNYGWDFSPRLIHLGIWDGVYLEAMGPIKIEDVWARPALDPATDEATVTLAVSLDSLVADQPAQVRATLSSAGEMLATTSSQLQTTAGLNRLVFTLAIDRPRVWWPNGLGGQPLYEAEVRVLTGAGESDSRTISFAFRDVKLVRNETADPSARPYTFLINGRKVYIKGWNWVPIDVLYGPERPDKLERLMRLAQRAGVNLFRVWGGGLIEKEEFYEWCDRLGIMVWQEFILSSSGIESRPSDDPAYIEAWTREAEQVIPLKRNHPSLVLWCGGNELQREDGSPLDERTPVLAALRDVVKRLDPDRAWLPTSPSGRAFANNLSNLDQDPTALHDVHGPWEYQGVERQYTLYDCGSSLFSSEFGAEGVTNRKVLAVTVSVDRLLPFSRSNPVWAHRGGWWVNEEILRDAFGDITDIDALIRASQFLQAEGLRFAVESNLRRIGQNSGSIPWQFDESFPNAASTSAIDYFADPKPAYFAVARAYEPIHVSARYPTIAWGGRSRFRSQVFACNTGNAVVEHALLRARLIDGDMTVLAEEKTRAALAPYESRQFLEIESTLPGGDRVFYLDLELTADRGEMLSRNRYAFTTASMLVPLLSIPETELEVSGDFREEHWKLELRNTGNAPAFCVWLEDARPPGSAGFVYFGDNWIILFPGEARTLNADWIGVGHGALRVQGWNTKPYLLGQA